MPELEVCKTCGVPSVISTILSWGDNGIISVSYSPKARMVFYESVDIDNVFRGVERLIGEPIEQIVMERRRRDTRKFMERVFPEEIERMSSFLGEDRVGEVSSVEPSKRHEMPKTGELLFSPAITFGTVYGYGDIRYSELWEFWDTSPWRNQIICNPYSIIFFSADMLATVEAFEQRDMRIKYEKICDDVYLISALPGEHPIELADRLKRKIYETKPGDISYECCPECGVPQDVARYRWNLEEGTIIDPNTGRRMAFFDPAAVDLVFEDLKAELGESVPEAIIEAQRHYAKLSMSGESWRRSGFDFKAWAAMRGLGNITAFKSDEKRLTLTLENPSMHLAVVGMAIALYELAWNTYCSTHEWHITDDGDLVITLELYATQVPGTRAAFGLNRLLRRRGRRQSAIYVGDRDHHHRNSEQ